MRGANSLSARSNFYPFALAAFALAAGTSITTLALLLSADFRMMVGLNVVLGVAYFAAPVIWLIIFIWARRQVGRKANWLFLGLPFALEPWLITVGVFVMLWYECTHGICEL